VVAHGQGQKSASERLLGQQVIYRFSFAAPMLSILMLGLQTEASVPKPESTSGLVSDYHATTAAHAQPTFRRPAPPSGSRRVIQSGDGGSSGHGTFAAEGSLSKVQSASQSHHSLPTVVSRAMRRTIAGGLGGAISESAASAAESVVLASIGAHVSASSSGGFLAAEHRVGGPRESSRFSTQQQKQQQQLETAIQSAGAAIESLSYSALRRGAPAGGSAAAASSAVGNLKAGSSGRTAASSVGLGSNRSEDSVRKYLQSSRSESSAAMFSSIYSAIAERERTRLQVSGTAAVKPRAPGNSMLDALQLRADTKRYGPSQTQNQWQSSRTLRTTTKIRLLMLQQQFLVN